MKIEIKGTIISDNDQWIYDWFDLQATSPSKVNKLIDQAKEGEELEVIINSGGGSVFAGSEIYSTLKDYAGNVVVKVFGIAGSSASVIAMAGDKTLISPTGQIMIHNASITGSGNKNDMKKTEEVLTGIDKSIANAYQLKTGMGQSELLNLMNEETWLTAQDALSKKFVDEVMFDNEKIIASVESCLLPASVINKIKNERLKNKQEKEETKNKTEEEKIENTEELELAKAKLNLLTI